MKKWKQRIAKEWLMLLSCFIVPWIFGVGVVLIKDIMNAKPKFEPTKPYEITMNDGSIRKIEPSKELTAEEVSILEKKDFLTDKEMAALEASSAPGNAKITPEELQQIKELTELADLRAKKYGYTRPGLSYLSKEQKIRLAQLLNKKKMTASNTSKRDEYAVKPSDPDFTPDNKTWVDTIQTETLFEQIKSVFFDQTLIISVLLYPLTMIIRFTIWAIKNFRNVQIG